MLKLNNLVCLLRPTTVNSWYHCRQRAGITREHRVRVETSRSPWCSTCKRYNSSLK